MNNRVALVGIALLSIGSTARATWNCPADFNRDCFITGEDFDAYVAEFELGNDSADYNGDGFVTGEDFDSFVENFQAGCPRDDFNGDGNVDCRDLAGFMRAFGAGDPAADLDCNGIADTDDLNAFLNAYSFELVDRNHNGVIDCADPCVFLGQWSAGSPAADYSCDGSVDLSDSDAFLADFTALHQGSPCPGCPK